MDKKEMKQTAVEWLEQKIEKLLPDFIGVWQEEFQQAKAMEKEQIIDAFYQCGKDNFEHIKVINRSSTDYYNETYGSKSGNNLTNHTNK